MMSVMVFWTIKPSDSPISLGILKREVTGEWYFYSSNEKMSRINPSLSRERVMDQIEVEAKAIYS